jgi:hypothetical protein
MPNRRLPEGAIRTPAIACCHPAPPGGSLPPVSNQQESGPRDLGANFPQVDGRRSTTSFGRQVFADSVRGIDIALSDRIEATRDWRGKYVGPARDVVALGVRSPQVALRIAEQGLASLHAGFVQVQPDGSEANLLDAVRGSAGRDLATLSIRGAANQPAGELRLPFRGRPLVGSDLRAQLSRWTQQGVAEPSLEAALSAVVDHPEWLDLRGRHFVVLGAGAELSPTQQLLQWGAEVWAVELPRPDAWKRILRMVEGTPGTLHIPVPAGEPLPGQAEAHSAAGADLIAEAPAVRRWLARIPGPFVLANYGYADGALNMRLSMASDAISVALRQERGDDVTLAFLATPTDAFAVPAAAMEAARAGWDSNRLARAARRPMQVANLFQPNYVRTARTDEGVEVGIADCIVPQQGPNYLLAKRLQRWRATVERAAGQRVSLNVAPATRTRSVVKNKALAAAYAGAHRFGIEVFDADTTRTSTSALIVRDLLDPASVADPAVAASIPIDLFADAANHGGLWRTPYDPRSVLGVAAVVGLFERGA